MVHQLYNVTNQTEDISTSMEFLQIVHLTQHGKMYALDLSSMETRIMHDGLIKEHGIGVQPQVEENEFLFTSVRMRTVQRATAVLIKALLFDGFSIMPTTIFVGSWGNLEPKKANRFWEFPQLDAVATLHRIMTEGG